MTDKIELNDDGKTAYCDFCKRNKPTTGFKIDILFHQTYDSPAEYGQKCQDCQDAEAKQEAAMQSYYDGLQSQYEKGEL